MQQVDKEKYERRYKWNNHMRGIVMGILLTVIYYEFLASESLFCGW